MHAILVLLSVLSADSSPVLVGEPQSITVTAGVDPATQSSDPARQFFLTDELPVGKPGSSLPSIPGLPVESASGGIKAPQYFAPGVAGDHGEPIAQYLQIGGALIGNNLSANAHGNGYSDPNFLIGSVLESVDVDSGAFNVREGNHAVNLAAAWSLRSRLEPFVTFTAGPHDAGIAAGWSPFRPETRAWFAFETAWGNGPLDQPEHRRQYKLNGYRVIERGAHQVTIFGAAYYGHSNIPGLVPIDGSTHDTIDPRQRDETHTTELVATDEWHTGLAADLRISAWFRTYSLALYSNFGDGLIRQSEFRTVAGGSQQYSRRFNRAFHLLAGADTLRDAPRRLDLDRYDPFRSVTSDNVTIQSVSPYVSIGGLLQPWLKYDLGWRRDEIHFDDTDLLEPASSTHRWASVNSPRATVGFVPREGTLLPAVSLSFGQAFYTNDPRQGATTLVSRAHALQLVVNRTLAGIDFRATLGRVTQEQSLARLDPDTGLQYNQGPSRNRFITLAASRRFNRGMFQTSFSKADARDLTNGAALPEAPRLIFDTLATIDRLPLRLRAHVEYEYVGVKPLGDGLVSVPLREFRTSLSRSFYKDHLDAALHLNMIRGWAGQTTEVLDIERVVGVRQPSSATVSLSWHFR